MLIIDPKKYPKPRSRHHNASNVYFSLSALDKTPRFYPPLYDSIEWRTMFGNGLPPTVLDIGCGWGNFLLQYAHKNPDRNILGLEVRKLPVDWINQVVSGENISNAHSLWYSLPNGLQFVKDNSVKQIFSFFPDPWIKKKHHKRRAFNSDLIQELLRIAEDNATLWLMTDVAEVAKYELELLQAFPTLHLEHLDFIGTWNEEWEIVFRNSLTQMMTPNSTDTWNIPKTDQELFSLKKDIPYLRFRYRIHKS